MICRDVLYIAFREARILLRPQAVNSDNELADGLIFLNQQVNYWAARGCYAWTTRFGDYQLAAGHQPHLIGPGLIAPDLDLTPRPTAILSAALVLPEGTSLTITVRDKDWWGAKSNPATGSTIPTDLYYEPDVPSGRLWFWPVPQTANQVTLETNVVLQEFATLDDPFVAPQAYLAAVTLTLAEELADIWGSQAPPTLARRALKARDALQSNNFKAPRIASADYGTFARPSADFNYMTGTIPD